MNAINEPPVKGVLVLFDDDKVDYDDEAQQNSVVAEDLEVVGFDIAENQVDYQH